MSETYQDMAAFIFEQLEKVDLPKGLQDKIPEGFAFVNMTDAEEKVEQISAQFDEAAEASLQRISQAATRFGFGGLIIGAGLGAVAGYLYCRKRLDDKYSQIAEMEINSMREHYRAKVVAVEGSATKPELEALVRDKGYSAEPPMAVTPPNSVVEAAEEKNDLTVEEHLQEMERRTASTNSDISNTPERVFDKAEPQPETGWDYHTERTRRSPLRPYIIHIDERGEMQSYDEVTYTYYESDDVVCNEIDEVIGPPDRDRLIGEAHLNQFGHGSGDPSIVYIRNDQAEVVIELIRSPNSYAEEVHGFRHSDPTYPRHRKVKFDDDE